MIFRSHSGAAALPLPRCYLPHRTPVCDKIAQDQYKIRQAMPLQLPHLSLDNNVTELSGKACHAPICSPGATYCLLILVSHCFYGFSYQGANLTDMSRPLRHPPVPMNHLILQWRSKEGSYMQGATGLSPRVQMCMGACTFTRMQTQKNVRSS